jgi:AraC family transcriptional regulator
MDLAQVAGMSPYYFMRMFKKSMHVTPRQYIIQTRIDRVAIERIIEACAPSSAEADASRTAVADIALQCGFTSQSHFTNVFRQIAKTTPKSYQRDFG